MSNISTAHAIASHSGKAVIPFLVGGYPSESQFIDTLQALSSAGAPAIEIGFPFSDPIADGPIIAQSMHEALQAGATTSTLFNAIKNARSSISAALVAMVSISIVARKGFDQFAREAAEAGFNALLVPDAPVDEISPIQQAASAHNLELSLLIAPSTPEHRATNIAKSCSAFTYLLARAGITGSDQRATSQPAVDLNARIQQLRPHAAGPIACGFGISTPQHVSKVLEHADAAIVGTALVKQMRNTPDNPTQAADSLYRLLIA